MRGGRRQRRLVDGSDKCHWSGAHKKCQQRQSALFLVKARRCRKQNRQGREKHGGRGQINNLEVLTCVANTGGFLSLLLFCFVFSVLSEFWIDKSQVHETGHLCTKRIYFPLNLLKKKVNAFIATRAVSRNYAGAYLLQSEFLLLHCLVHGLQLSVHGHGEAEKAAGFAVSPQHIGRVQVEGGTFQQEDKEQRQSTGGSGLHGSG